MKSALISTVIGAAIILTPLSAIAADTKGPLAPGSAAGVKQAQGLGGIPLVFWLGGIVVVTAAILAVSNSNDNSTPTVTTTNTAP